MGKILGILPHSIGGRLTTSSILDGFRQNGFEVVVYDELKDDNFSDFLKDDYRFIVGYDFSPVKLKIDYDLKIPCIAYFSDVIQDKTSGVGYKEYFKYLKNSDIFVFYWDRVLAKKDGFNYQAHFVNTEIYKNYLTPIHDVMFMGRLDTDLRLNIYLELNKKLSNLSFRYYGIEKHYLDALSRCQKDEDKKILEQTYCGFIDNEVDMARVINEVKIVYNINAQGVSSLNYRSIQTLACERLLISDVRDELDIFENKIPTYENIDDLVKKINYFLQNKKEYDKITSFSRNIIEKELSSKVCIEKMLSILSEKV